jgi:hypothetical protein
VLTGPPPINGAEPRTAPAEQVLAEIVDEVFLSLVRP